MKEYEFTLILDQNALSEELVERLCVAGCDDALPTATQGTVRLIFGREAESLEQAIRSAIADVQTAGYVVVRVEIEAGADVLKT